MQKLKLILGVESARHMLCSYEYVILFGFNVNDVA